MLLKLLPKVYVCAQTPQEALALFNDKVISPFAREFLYSQLHFYAKALDEDPPVSDDFGSMLLSSSRGLPLTLRALGDLCDVSSNTVIRWCTNGGPVPHRLVQQHVFKVLLHQYELLRAGSLPVPDAPKLPQA
jgi:hypothetical protein